MKWFVFFVFAILIASGMRAMSVVNKLRKAAPQNQRTHDNVQTEAKTARPSRQTMVKDKAQVMEKCPRCAAYVVAGEVHCGRTGCPFPEKGQG